MISIYDIRLFNLRKIETELTRKELAKRLDKDPNLLGQYLSVPKDPAKNPKRRITEEFARYIEKQLHLPKYSIDKNEEKKEEAVDFLIRGDNIVFVPLINVDESEKSGIIITSEKPSDKLIVFMKILEELNAQPKDCVALKVMDDAMMPTIRKGEFVAFDQSKTAIESAKIYAFWRDGKILIRRLFYIENDIKIMVDSAAHKLDFPDEIIKKDRLRIIGKAVYRASGL